MLSLHIIADNSDPKKIDRAIDYLINTHQPAVNVAGGSQIDVAKNIVERIHARAPEMKVFWRILQDTGSAVNVPDLTWWSQSVQPRLSWMKAHKIIMVTDNETSGDDNVIKSYVQHCIVRANMLHDNGLNGAFCRFATGNIQESQYVLLKPLLDVLNDGDWISPNEYSNIPGHSSSGHLERWKRIQAVTNKRLNFAIGECGVLVDYKPNTGYHTIGMSGANMAAQLLADEVWYNGGSIPRFMFCVGGYSEWDTLQIGDDALTFLEEYYAKNPIGNIIPTTPPVTPPVTIPPLPPATVTLTPAQVIQIREWRTELSNKVALLDAILATVK